MCGLVVSVALVVDYLRWPVIGMGGIIARMMILAVLSTQVVPLAGFLVARRLGRERPSGWAAAFWGWFVLALAALAFGALGAMIFHRPPVV